MRPFLKRLMVRNFKSIENCDVSFGPLTVVVGRNGAGKSNFLDSLHFITDGLQTSLDHAIKSRGGIDAVRRRSTGHPRNFAIALEFDISDGLKATYAFEVAARPSGAFAVKREKLTISRPHAVWAYFNREEAILTDAFTGRERSVMPPVSEDRLYLVNAAGLPEFRPAYDALLAMGFYNLNPDAMKEVQSPDAGELLHGDGSNIASVIARLSAQQPATVERIREYLRSIVPGIESFDRESLGPKETLIFHQRVEGATHPWRFYASSMSDGTLRALGALVAVTQLANSSQPIRLVGIEEPETALHPAATGALMDALREACAYTQVVVTTHSPDFLDQIDSDRDTLLVVDARGSRSRIAIADPASRRAIQEHLYSPGELLRMDQLQPDEAFLMSQQEFDFFAASARSE